MAGGRDPDRMTVAEVAVRFGVGLDTVYAWVRHGHLPTEMRPGEGNRQYMRRADVRAFAALHYRGKARPAWLDELEG